MNYSNYSTWGTPKNEPDESLYYELYRCLKEVELTIKASREMAEQMGLGSVYEMRDINGRFVMADLLRTKADLLLAIRSC